MIPSITIQSPKGLEDSVELFLKSFNSKINDYHNLIENRPVNRALFVGEDKNKGFLHDFFTCLNNIGLNEFAEKFKSKLNFNGSIPYMEYFKILSMLPPNDLEKISKLYSEIGMDSGNNKGYLSSKYHILSQYFNNSNSKTKYTGQAGRFIMIFSQACKVITDISKFITENGRIFLSRFNSIIDLLHGTPKPGSKTNSLANIARDAIKKLYRGIKNSILNIPAINNLLNKLKEQRKTLLALMIIHSKKNWHISRNHLHEAQSQLKLLEEWHEFSSESPEDTLELLKIKSFNSSVNNFTNELVSRMEVFDSFIERITKCINENRLVSYEIQNILERILKSLDKVITARVSLEQEVRIPLQKTRVRIKNLSILHGRHYQSFNNQHKEIPEDLQEKLNYIESEVINTLSRANPIEIKNLSKTLLYIYTHTNSYSISLANQENDQNMIKENFKNRISDILYTSGKIFQNGSISGI